VRSSGRLIFRKDAGASERVAKEIYRDVAWNVESRSCEERLRVARPLLIGRMRGERFIR